MFHFENTAIWTSEFSQYRDTKIGMLSRRKKSLLSILSSITISSVCLCAGMLVSQWKESAFIEKVNSRRFCWFLAAILVHQNSTPIWRLHTKLYKGAWNVSTNNSETVGHKDLRLGQIVYNISFSWLLPLDGFQCIILLHDNEKNL